MQEPLVRRFNAGNPDLFLLQRARYPDLMAGKFFCFVLVVQFVNSFSARIEQNVFGAQLDALGTTSGLIFAHAFHVLHHLVVRPNFGAQRIHNLAGKCRDGIRISLRSAQGESNQHGQK